MGSATTPGSRTPRSHSKSEPGPQSPAPPPKLLEAIKKRYPGVARGLLLDSANSAKQHHISWLLKIIEEIYDSRYQHDTGELELWFTAESGGRYDIRLNNAVLIEAWSADSAPKGVRMSEFLIQFCSKRYGLRAIVERALWELLCNAEAARQARIHTSVLACHFHLLSNRGPHSS
ncbi:hypothetical protein CYMTET_18522 [Cymbomonas tetramitiformis]|uniref:Uncharacterized protein n=1 Tax=Cymbomonas tetramitiformis TaxID=36881 RepID=A0AAE0L637_9CHLO|nr:hypothetical protein CYMTET_18522 [Cymbomonas tetramitiformis]